jgi:hypothetical protein
MQIKELAMGQAKIEFEVDEHDLANAKVFVAKVSAGSVSIIEAARLLELPDAGFVLSRLSALGLPLPNLSDEAVRQQLNSARSALGQCLLEPEPKQKRKAKRTDESAVA